MTNSNINEIKKRLFGNLEVKIIRDPENPEEVTFERKQEVFGAPSIFTEYNLESKEIKVYQNCKGRRKILYNGNISDLQELNKYSLAGN